MKKFWSTKDAGQKPFTYQAGVGGVIKGWDQGCLGMQIGEVRKLRIPADEGYGAGGFPAWGIPRAAPCSSRSRSSRSRARAVSSRDSNPKPRALGCDGTRT